MIKRLRCGHTDKRKKVLTIVAIMVLMGLAYFAIYFILGFNVSSRNEAVRKEFEVDNKTVVTIFHFKSTDGSFSTGKTIHVDGLLYYPTKTNPNEQFALDLPNTLTPTDYNLLSNDILWRTHENGSILTMPLDVLTESPHYFSGLPVSLSVDFDTVWTQEGFQDGYLEIHDSTNATNIKKILIDKIISIQPSDVSQNLSTNNIILGLTFYMIALSLVTIFLSIGQTSTDNRNTNH
jgi:hypothetical protein